MEIVVLRVASKREATNNRQKDGWINSIVIYNLKIGQKLQFSMSLSNRQAPAWAFLMRFEVLNDIMRNSNVFMRFSNFLMISLAASDGSN